MLHRPPNAVVEKAFETGSRMQGRAFLAAHHHVEVSLPEQVLRHIYPFQGKTPRCKPIVIRSAVSDLWRKPSTTEAPPEPPETGAPQATCPNVDKAAIRTRWCSTCGAKTVDLSSTCTFHFGIVASSPLS